MSEINILQPEVSKESISSDDSEEEFCYSPFATVKQIKIANSCDEYVWVGIQGDRKTNTGGQEYHIDIMDVFGAGFTRSTKEHELISRVPWKRIQFHGYVF